MSPILYWSLWKDISKCSPHLRSRELAPPRWGWCSYINYLPIFYTVFFSIHPFIHLFKYLFTLTWAKGNLFWILDYNPVLLYLFCCSHWELFQLAPVVCSINMSPSMWAFFVGFLFVFAFLVSVFLWCGGEDGDFIFLYHKMLQVHCVYLLYKHGIGHFTK